MTYVLDQTGAELREHMRRITDGSGWDDPLSTRLWVEVQALDETVIRLKQEKAVLLSNLSALDDANRRLLPICDDPARYDRGECCGGKVGCSGARDEEAAELFLSERISAALATYDYVLGDADPSEPDHEERTFDAMKAAIQKADHIARSHSHPAE